MPTPTPMDDYLLSSVASLPTGPVRETETQSLRRICREQEARIATLTAEIAELQTLLDNANRRATVAECRLKTAEADLRQAEDEIGGLRRAVFPGRGNIAVSGRHECGGKS